MKAHTKPALRAMPAVQVQISLPVQGVLRDVRHAFLGLCIDAGQKALAAMMEADRVALCGPKGVPDAARRAVRGGTTASQVVLGGQRIAVRRPRSRSMTEGELALRSFEWAAGSDPLDAATMGKTPTAVQLIDITPKLVLKFLAHLERDRHNSVRSRNLRLTALRTFLKFAGRRDVTALHAVERVMAVPMKRFERPLLGHLTRPEMIAVLGQPGADWTSQRDHLLLSLLYNTGARVSEIVGVRVVDVALDGAACVHLHGKGRKDRSMPLWKSTAAATDRDTLAAERLHPKVPT